MGQEEQKTTWMLIAKLLAGEASPEEIRRLETLLKDDPELHYPMQTLNDVWKAAAKPDNEEANRAFERHLERLGRLNEALSPAGETGSLPHGNRPAGRRRMLWATVATMAVLIPMIWLITKPTHLAPVATTSQQVSPPREFRAAIGSRIFLTLPDGTKIWLNAGSRLLCDKNFNSTRRDVTLVGEAYFDAARDAQRPFFIHTDRVDIRVLGTSFNVKSYPTETTTEATLIRGSIEVSVKARPAEKIILKPEQKLIVGTASGTIRPAQAGSLAAAADIPPVNIGKPTYEKTTGTIIETSWVNNKLSFKDETFGDLARQMERWYGISIRFSDPSLERLEFTGSFKEESIGQALQALKLTANFSYEIDGDQVTINK